MQDYQPRNARQVESAYRPLAAKLAENLRSRATHIEQGEKHLSRFRQKGAAWHRNRAATADRELEDVTAECATKYIVTACGCTTCGRTALCGRYKYCATCLTKRRRESFAKMAKAINGALGDNEGASVYLCTITTSHSGNIADDFAFLKRAVPEYLERARAFGALGPYVYVYEMTNGVDGLGHVHAHVALLARWTDYAESAEQWRAVSAKFGRAGAEDKKLQVPNFQKDTKGDTRRSPGEVASYLASHALPSYLSKADESEGLTDKRLGEWIGATYGKRLVITSIHFWTDKELPLCKCCGSRRTMVGFAHSVQRLEEMLESALKLGFATEVRLQEPCVQRLSIRPPES